MLWTRFRASKITVEAIDRWSDPTQDRVLSYGDAAHAFHIHSPRVRFIKTLPARSEVLDMGAGDGGLIAYREWPAPERRDIQMYAWAGEEGARFREWHSYEVGWWPQSAPGFDGRMFDAIHSSNFIEHIARPKAFVGWAASRLKSGGLLFLEWPSPSAIDLPSCEAFRAAGLPVITGRFDDDATHQPRTPPLPMIARAMRRAGLRVLDVGLSKVPFYDQQLAISARRENDAVSFTQAYWSRSEWLQYLVARKS